MSRRDRLERAIESGKEWVGRLSREREAIEAMKHPPADELARVTSAEAGQAKMLSRNLAELKRLPVHDGRAQVPQPDNPA